MDALINLAIEQMGEILEVRLTCKNNNRTIRLQAMVSESMDEKILMEARKFGLSISSYLELILGKHLARNGQRDYGG